MKARIVSLTTLTERDVEEWSALRDRAIDPYPFLDPRMIVASLPHMPLAREMRVIFVEDDSRLVVVMPFVVGKLRGRVRLAVVSTRTKYLDDQGGWDHPLVDAERAVEAMEGLFRGMRSLGLPRLVEFSSLPMGGELEKALGSAAGRCHIPLLERERSEFVYATRLPERDKDKREGSSADDSVPSFTLDHISPRLRKDLSRRADRLAKDLDADLRIEDRSDDPTAIAEFVELQSGGWKGDTTRGGEGIRVRGDEEWFREVTDRYRADGALLVLALVAGETALYVRVSTRIGDGIFGWFDAYDERFSDYRPGVLGRVASMNRILAISGVRIFDPNFHPSTGDAKKLFPERRDRATILAANGGVVARAMVLSLPAARSLKRRALSLRQQARAVLRRS